MSTRREVMACVQEYMLTAWCFDYTDLDQQDIEHIARACDIDACTVCKYLNIRLPD